VALQKWRIFGKERLGVCTDYLCRRVPLHAEVVPVYINPHRGFTLPEDKHTPIIMIGPGTGIAPFRAFMQEREVLDAAGKNWLFFGEWNRFHHYFYEDFWSSLEQKGKLRVDLAFSRDQKDKIYVQHRMIENGKEIYRWLQEGAYFYVCGDASNMAKDVEAALQKILINEGGLSEEQSREYIKALRKEGRYLRDVY
jgi:sulfite reductase (NADPH) flavoprotein alpha-component